METNTHEEHTESIPSFWVQLFCTPHPFVILFSSRLLYSMQYFIRSLIGMHRVRELLR